jgi:hypothetical protein
VDTVYYGHDYTIKACSYTKKNCVHTQWNTSADGKGAPFKAGHSLRLDRNIVLYAQWYEYVDLGLSVKWATCNVGATTSEAFGDYFAWGEVAPKEIYSFETYKYCQGTEKSLTKYCCDKDYGLNGFVDNKLELDPEDDAASVNWGGKWRMPTADEFDELRYSCTWEWTTQNGVKGYKVTGPNGNSIFLPTVGCMREGTLCDAGSYGYYLSSSLEALHPDYAYGERFDSGNVYWKLSSRCFGQSVRPVCWLAGDKE